MDIYEMSHEPVFVKSWTDEELPTFDAHVGHISEKHFLTNRAIVSRDSF